MLKFIIVFILVAILCGMVYIGVEEMKNNSIFLDYQARCTDAGGEVVFTLPLYTCYENQIFIER